MRPRGGVSTHKCYGRDTKEAAVKFNYQIIRALMGSDRKWGFERGGSEAAVEVMWDLDAFYQSFTENAIKFNSLNVLFLKL